MVAVAVIPKPEPAPRPIRTTTPRPPVRRGPFPKWPQRAPEGVSGPGWCRMHAITDEGVVKFYRVPQSYMWRSGCVLTLLTPMCCVLCGLAAAYCASKESIRHESEGWGFEPPSGRDIFFLKNFDALTRTSVHVSKINVVARTQLTFQMSA